MNLIDFLEKQREVHERFLRRRGTPEKTIKIKMATINLFITHLVVAEALQQDGEK